MTTSGSTSFNPAVADLIAQALRQLGVIAEDESPTAGMYATALFQLNAIVTAAQATGLHVWTEEEAVIFLQPKQVKYTIGSPGLNARTSDESDWLELKLSIMALGGDTTISVETTLTAEAGQNIGVILNDGSTFWTTISGFPADAVIDLASPIPDQGASSGSFVLVYSDPISRPLKVPAARLLYLNNLNETPMTIMSRQEYMDTPNKLSPGTPTQWFYAPKRDLGLFYVWPAPQSSNYAIRFTWYRALQDFFTPGDTMDFPQEWVSPLMWTLAADLIGVYDVPIQRQQYVMAQMQKYGDLAISYDRESEPVSFGMDWQFTQGA